MIEGGPFPSMLRRADDRIPSIQERIKAFRRAVETIPDITIPPDYENDEHFWYTALTEYGHVHEELRDAIRDKETRRTKSMGIAINSATSLLERDGKVARDPKTGAWSYDALINYSQNIINLQPVKAGLVFLDLDDFKKYNEKYGHVEADELLVKLSQLLQNNVRPIDMVGRFGGEEFAIVIPHLGRRENIVDVADRLCRQLQEELGVTASFGATMIRKRDTLKKLYKRAVLLMQEAKANGKNCVMGDRAGRRGTSHSA